ncbi:PREDICTED: ATP-dependent RNA helicase DHX36 [Dufourea novaeangliae]|uniref:RNA helicase n=1 Tax=Dufourea novaeangliae TaxID=178035 RepID=A0A154PD24_DUFNO|nr:PREDICTED: ATP-dependent RNA helicase DHX36 [Dufourea novaeangliae]KZC09687.1 putative ATP-dependent RNA helicase DHX36 [Dufourea novaeangliae]
MSHPYGMFSGQGNHQRRNKYGDRVENSQSGSSRFEHEGHGRGGGRPPWLKGKEIGLYYRDRGKTKRMEKETQIIKLPENMQRNIDRVLEKSKGFYDKLYNNEEQAESTNSRLENKYTHIHDSQFKRKFLNIVSGNIQENISKAVLLKSGIERNSSLDDQLLDEYKSKESTGEYESMMKFRLKLPAYEKRSEILELIKENQVAVISGETGCGKTTQVPQFILDDQIEQGNGSIARIICTQPRRISAISVAERVAAERAERLGKSVGFHIRLEKVLPRDRGSITFCTAGMLLQFMQSDPSLKNCSHIILDEIHERTTESDFIIALLKLIIPKRPDLKVLLMSATLNSESFSKYYNDCPMIHIPGFTYPVEELYLEDVLLLTKFKFPEPSSAPQNYKKHLKKYKQTQRDNDEFSDFIHPYTRQLIAEQKFPKSVIEQLRNPNSEKMSLNLIEELIRHICVTKTPGAILVFLPGMMDIIKLHTLMADSGRYPQSKYIIYPLHSRMPTVDQKLIFKEPPEGVRKIIIATSIAETSITIEDVVYVIDCGRTKFLKFDVVRNIETLLPEWVSLANAKQRRGRAGRVKPGICYHLYSKAREMTLEQYPLPEMLRTRLDNVILQIKILQLGKARSFLASVMDPPNTKAIDLSLELLGSLNALDNEENLTPLGYHLAQLPLDPRTGKMIIWAALFSCVEPVFAIAASLTFKDAFYCPLGKEEQAKQKKLELSMNQYSDHIALAEALRRFETSYKRGNAGYFCREYFLSFNTLKLLSEMKTQFAQHLYQMKFLETANSNERNANRNSDNDALVKAIVCAGLYPNVAVIRRVTKNGTHAWTPEDGKVVIHPSSVNDKIKDYSSPYITYFTKQRSTATYLHDTSCVTAPILLFAAPNMCIKKEKGNYFISLTSSQKFVCDLRTAQLIQKLQEELNNMLEYKVMHPGTVTWNGHEGNLLNAIIDLVCQKGVEMGFSEPDVEECEDNFYDSRRT